MRRQGFKVSKFNLAVHSVPADLTTKVGQSEALNLHTGPCDLSWRRLNVLVQLLEYHPNHTDASKLTRRELLTPF